MSPYLPITVLFHFRTALIDSFLHFNDSEASDILVGGFDEITSENYELKKSIGQFKETHCTNLDIKTSKSGGSIPGEGISFFMLSDHPAPFDYAVLETVKILSSCKSEDNIKEWLKCILSGFSLDFDAIDLILTGFKR